MDEDVDDFYSTDEDPISDEEADVLDQSRIMQQFLRRRQSQEFFEPTSDRTRQPPPSLGSLLSSVPPPPLDTEVRPRAVSQPPRLSNWRISQPSFTPQASSLPSRPRKLSKPLPPRPQDPDLLTQSVTFVLPQGYTVVVTCSTHDTVLKIKHRIWRKLIAVATAVQPWSLAPWWHGNVTKEGTEQRLHNTAGKFPFLVRRGPTPAHFILSALNTDQCHIYHIPVVQSHDGRFELASKNTSGQPQPGHAVQQGGLLRFYSLPELVAHLRDNPLVLPDEMCSQPPSSEEEGGSCASPTVQFYLQTCCERPLAPRSSQRMMVVGDPHSHSQRVFHDIHGLCPVSADTFASEFGGYDGHLRHFLAFETHHGKIRFLANEQALFFTYPGVEEALARASPFHVLPHAAIWSDGAGGKDATAISSAGMDKLGGVIGCDLQTLIDTGDQDLAVARYKLAGFAAETRSNRDIYDYAVGVEVEDTALSASHMADLKKTKLRLCIYFDPPLAHQHQAVDPHVHSHAQVLLVPPETTPAEVISRAFPSIRERYQLPKSALPEHYILRMAGLQSFLSGNHPLVDFSCVRRSLLNDEPALTLRIAFVADIFGATVAELHPHRQLIKAHQHKLGQSNTLNDEHGKETDQDKNTSPHATNLQHVIGEEKTSDKRKQLEQENQVAPLPTVESLPDLGASVAVSLALGKVQQTSISLRGKQLASEATALTPAHHVLAARENHPTARTPFSLWDCHREFRFLVTGIDGLLPPPDNLSGVIRVVSELRNAQELICPATSTFAVPFSSHPRWYAMVRFDLMTCDLPRTTELVIHVQLESYGKSKKKLLNDRVKDPSSPDTNHLSVPVAALAVPSHIARLQTASLQLFTAEARLRSGPTVLRMQPATQAKGTASDSRCFARLQFEEYSKPVLVPNEGGEFVDDPHLSDADERILQNQTACAEQPDWKRDEEELSTFVVDNTGDTTNRLLEIPGNLLDVVVKLACKDGGIATTDIRYNSKKYKSAFHGRTFLTWCEFTLDMSRHSALQLGQRLIRLHVLRPLSEDLDFADDKRPFTFEPFTRLRPIPGTRRYSALLRDREQQQQLKEKEQSIARAQQKMKQATQQIDDQRRLSVILSADMLKPLSANDAVVLLRNREECTRYPVLLPKFLLAVDWANGSLLRTAYRLLPKWTRPSPETALEMLDYVHADTRVRSYAVEILRELSDEELLDYLLQLVQVLKFEAYHDSGLARFLLGRALQSTRIGHRFFWLLRAEIGDKAHTTRYALLLEAFLRHCGEEMLLTLRRQTELLQQLEAIAQAAKTIKNGSVATDTARSELDKLKHLAEWPVPMVYNLSLEVSGIVADQCRVLGSKKRPLWLSFRNADPAGRAIPLLFKCGDDLRQDMLTLQMLRLMDKLWQQEGLVLHMKVYGCVATALGVGVIQAVPDARTVSSIQLAFGGSLSAFKDEPIHDWLRQQNPSDEAFEGAKDRFMLSSAAYCVATYVLGIGDRHNDNIMVTKDGHFFHIDFGHFLGNVKSKFGVKRERVPFVLTPDMVYVMGKKDGKRFLKFVDTCVEAYLILRRRSRLLIALFAMMLHTGMEELNSSSDIDYLRDALALEVSEQEAANAFRKLVHICLSSSWSTQINFLFHNIKHA
eukprot:m.79675 g.79675  ORF g.79675 m.79675 type:complete len:1630 (+) comp20870_c0_seq5:130-5019(+)